MKLITEQQFSNFTNFVSSHDAFIIAGHKEPDGDCIASSLALGNLLRTYNKPILIINEGPFKRPETKKFEKYFAADIKPLTSKKERTGLFIVDCSETQRIGDLAQKIQNFDTFIIDHHKTGKGDPKSSIIDPLSPATAYLIQQIYEHECDTIPEETAKILFLGISTDTGFFRFLDSSSSEIFKALARLVEAGASPRKTYDYITSGKPFNTRKLLGIMLDRAEQYFDGRLIITYEKMSDTRKLAKEGRDSDALYSMLLTVENVEAVVFIRQESLTHCTVGLRSKDMIDVSAIASVFGGGGHKNASGLSTKAKIDTLKPQIIKEFSKIFQNN
ncbi:MAG: DHH family phosphoesterase [Treponema sp. CETP13]|nr:MAG: DHH family phosphoesterase [Treponema sp. CETP13]